MDADRLKEILNQHGKWLRDETGGERANLSYADLSSANLSSANLSYANLRSADLRYANLSSANLRYANLRYANLSSANLSYANLSSANLSYADLSSADLSSANLRYADLSSADLRYANLRYAKYTDDAIITGEPWKEYIGKVLPALLTAGGRTLDEVACPTHWDCHNWNNCPMAAAFGCKGPEGTPLLLRPRVEQFVQLFDAKLIPLELVNPKYAKAVARTPGQGGGDG